MLLESTGNPDFQTSFVLTMNIQLWEFVFDPGLFARLETRQVNLRDQKNSYELVCTYGDLECPNVYQ